MLLVFQIALGIVLGFVALRYLPQILNGLIIGVAALVGLSVIGVLIYFVANDWDENVNPDAFAISEAAKAVWRNRPLYVSEIAGFVLLAALVKLSSRGLAALYLSNRPWIIGSRHMRRFLVLLGVPNSWHEPGLDERKVATKVGDRIFTGVFKFLGGYLLLAVVIAVAIALPLHAAPVIDNADKPVMFAIWVGSFLAPGLAALGWTFLLGRPKKPGRAVVSVKGPQL